MASPSAFEYLFSAQHETGGWGYQTGHKPVVEPTAIVLLSIRNEPHINATFQRGVDWLLGCQHPDGGWGINENDPESGWQTAWALIVMKLTNQAQELISRAESWLSAVATYSISRDEFNHANLPQGKSLDALVWPWLPGQAGWLEPTVLAVLALKGILGSTSAAQRVASALDYLSYYRTPSGGWNIGNASELDTLVTPRAYQTALVLIALGLSAPQFVREIDLSALRQDLERDPGMLAQASGLLARQMHNQEVSQMASLVTNAQLSDGSWEHSPFVTAWALLGLRGSL